MSSTAWTALTPARAAAWAAVPTAALLTLNGFYLGDAYRTSPALFWLLDAVQFVAVPAASFWALARFAGVRPARLSMRWSWRPACSATPQPGSARFSCRGNGRRRASITCRRFRGARSPGCSCFSIFRSVALALIHWESGSRELVATFLLGVVLGALYLRLRNLWPFVAGHTVTDMLAFTGTYAY